ncbi:uncharacterized protein BCR38DRAFT_142746 [Pseudomassariella vexata]|uniref:NAD(P)-binding protein n=1 Tax=Pseudomassariella vexata TaxID=1141098 RepID=A0A1Y2EBV3_9PEZI|nr:uncharacterized protein BCR38DRAFT_142746 [Pseudomassariella vexata]ORY69022.1 hypothetical protein BCR38DRAFT_142746 [Pseudomassariella vexata]
MQNSNHKPQDARQSKVWLVTGCSSGFGRSLVPAILARGDRVVATARRVSDLDYLQHFENVKLLQLDVTSPDHVLSEKVEAAISAFGGIDVLVNNAGYVLSGVWEELRPEDTKWQFETNFFGALNLTRVVLPHMRSKGAGVILFMGSISGWHGVAAGGAYSASKFALEGAVECLAKEVKAIGIRVHILVIGQFRTNILDAKNKKGKLDADEGIVEYAAIKKQMADIHAVTQGAQPGDPSLAVERIVDLGVLENIAHEHVDNLPLRIPIGSDAVSVMRNKCQDTLTLLDKWADFASSTDYPDKIAVPGYYR